MTHTRQDVMSAVLNMFPDRSAKTVLELLDLYGLESHEPERERVQLAILALSKGNEDKLLHFVEAAKQDYRDVLYWAEYPQESGPDGLLLEVLRRSWAWALRILSISRCRVRSGISWWPVTMGRCGVSFPKSSRRKRSETTRTSSRRSRTRNSERIGFLKVWK